MPISPITAASPGTQNGDRRGERRIRPWWQSSAALFAVCVVGSFAIFFFRAPDPFLNPTFFAEDGATYIGALYADGFQTALRAARPDYLVLGNILLSWIAVTVCKVFFANNVLYLPQIVAAVVNLFLAAVVATPVVLLRNRLRPPFLFALWLLTSFVPLGHTDYEIFGRLANTGFAFFYLAVVLVWHRNRTTRFGWGMAATDALLWLCAATNPLTLALLPMLVLPYLSERTWKRLSPWQIVRQGSFLSLIMLAAACVPIVLAIVQGQPLPRVAPGPITRQYAVELTLARNILYPLVHAFYTKLSTKITLAICAAVVVGFFLFRRRRHLPLYVTGGYALALSSAVLLFSRRELANFIHGYGTSFPDRYFYAQNLIFLLLCVVLAADFSLRFHRSRLVQCLPLLLAGLFFYKIHHESTYMSPAPPFTSLGNFRTTLETAVSQQSFVDRSGNGSPQGEFVKINTYPASWTMLLPRDVVERSLGVPRDPARIALDHVESSRR